ncbi:MAG: EI24 domain-containing protein [Erythrobacter sp.]
MKGFGQLADPAVIRVAAKSVFVTLLVFLAGGAALWLGLWSAISTLFASFLPKPYNSAAVAVLAAFLWLVGFWLLFRIVALAVLQFFADEIVAAVEARHYPEAAGRAKPLPFARDLANSLRGTGRALALNLLALPLIIVLWITQVGPALVLLLVNAVLLGRELTDMAWLRHEGECASNPVPKAERFALGTGVAALMLVPVANLLAPVVGAAAGTHLTQRALARRAGTEPSDA